MSRLWYNHFEMKRNGNQDLSNREMIGIYLSGTGNTKHCVEKIVGLLDKTAAAIPLETSDVTRQIKNNDTIIFGYPIQFSNAPYMVRDFIKKNRSI